MVQIGRNAEPDRFDNWPWPAQRAFEERLTEVYVGVAAYAAASVVIGRGPGAVPGAAHIVSGEYFDVLRAPPVLGCRFRTRAGS